MTSTWSPVQATAIRLLPGQDLKSELIDFARTHELQAAAVISVVGSLSQVALRFANCPDKTLVEGKHEILSLSGTLSENGIHLHMCVANSRGQTLGGHVTEGSIIYTTAEVVIAEMSGLVFERNLCHKSGFLELEVKTRTEK